MSGSSPASPQAAAERVAGDLDDEIYVFLSDESPKNFLGEAVLIGISGALIAAFVKGLTASLEERVEEWGRRLGTWIADRVEQIASAEDPAAEGVNKILGSVAPELTQLSGVDLSPEDKAIVQDMFVNVLIAQGMTGSAALSAARSVDLATRTLARA